MSQKTQEPTELPKDLTPSVVAEHVHGQHHSAGATTVMASPAAHGSPRHERMVERAYREFCRRRQAGEALDPDDFCRQFPSIRSALTKMLQCHLFLAQMPGLAGEEEDTVWWPEAGEAFLDFQLQCELGEGAFARVFLAREPKLGDRLVAVKISKDGGPAEAHTLGRLLHPNIVPVHSVQADDETGLTAVCMPYLGSATLEDVIVHVFSQSVTKPQASQILEAARASKHPLEGVAGAALADPLLSKGTYVDAVRLIGAQLAEALAYIDGLGICHRDLKPSNVLMSPEGVPMLLDFNLSSGAKDVNSAFGGTMPYMAPEQLQAADPDGPGSTALLDGRADIFSLGVILYQMLTGQHPFGPVSMKLDARELRRVLIQRHLGGAPSPRRLNAEIDPALSRLVDRCLAYNPDDRPATAAQVADALRKDLTPRRRAQRWLRRHPRIIAACLAAVLTVGLVGGAVATHLPHGRMHPMDIGIQRFNEKRFVEARNAFNQALEIDPDNSDALFARGRAHQQMGAYDTRYYSLASQDYHALEKLAPSARTTACIGYCILKTNISVAQAALRFEAAIKGGVKTAEVYNNLGYCRLKTAMLDEAENNLDRALDLNPRLQAAYVNRGCLCRQRALDEANRFERDPTGTILANARNGGILKEIAKLVHAGVADFEKAIEIGPESADLHEQAAGLLAIGVRYGCGGSKEVALKHLSEAIKCGLSPRQLQSDRAYDSLQNDASFKDLCMRPLPQNSAQPTVRVVDPLNGRLR